MKIRMYTERDEKLLDMMNICRKLLIIDEMKQVQVKKEGDHKKNEVVRVKNEKMKMKMKLKM